MDNRRAILYMLASSICFAVVNTCVKFLDYIPVHELVLIRSLISISICLYFVRKLKLPLFGNNKLWLLGRGLFGASALTLFFYTIKAMDLATATVTQYLSPVFTVIIAMFLVNEKVRPIQWLFFLIAFAGIYLMHGHNLNSDAGLIVILGLCSALLSGFAYNCIMKCRTTDHPITVVMYFPLVAIPVMTVWTVFDWVPPKASDIPYLLIIGVFTQIAQVAMTKALHSGESNKIMPIKYFGSVWAILITLFIFNDVIPLVSYIGIGLVILGVVLNILVKNARQMANHDEQIDPPLSTQN